jgi:prepilin-type processing-associated H-X9-DG protein
MSKKQVLFIILCSLIIGGFGGWLFNRFLIPKINTIPFLVKYNLAPQTSPLVINKREEIRVNEGSDSIAAIQKVKPWLVGIVNGTDVNNAEIKAGGVVLTSDGLIAVPKSALQNLKAVNVVFVDGSVLPATIKTSDTASDLAFIKVERNNLATASLGYSKDMQLGQRIIVLSPTLTEYEPLAHVSYLSSEAKIRNEKLYSADQITQTFKVDDLTGVLNGSMALSLDGNVQGIYAGTNILTADTMRSALNSYFSTQKISRAQFGFSYAPISKVVANLYSLTSGAVVKSFTSKSALVEGDIITAVNDAEINVDNSLEDLLQRVKIGETVRLRVIRDAQTLNVDLVAGSK